MKLYIAVIEEVIMDPKGYPTLELRIRVPNLHYGLKKESLPIAKPMIIPGTVVDKNEFLDQIQQTTRVYVFFEQKNLNRPRYFATISEPYLIYLDPKVIE